MRMPTELHLHLEGTLEPEMTFRLAEQNRLDLPWRDPDELRARFDFTDLQSFLDLYTMSQEVLRTGEDFHALTDAYLARAAAAGVRHAEVSLDLQAHTGRGVRAAEVLDGVTSALQAAPGRHGLSAGLIVTVLRHLPGEAALATVREVVESGYPVLGLGLCSTELTAHARDFVEAFDLARAHGLHLTAHAGEEGPPQNVTGVLDHLRVERVDHGVRACGDPALVARLVAQRIPLTVCPVSNLRLRVVDALHEHPLRRMLDSGVMVTLNSDDPAYFGGYLDEVTDRTAEALDLGEEHLSTLARNGIDAAWVEESRRRELHAELERDLGGTP
ncbi:adenosine deaminase [Georgenia deserti]|uniref:Adenine deaminase n=1 Tax=Georgenia deserti TaxID=2093781 RepID=A0ABW4L995_9MICO